METKNRPLVNEASVGHWQVVCQSKELRVVIKKVYGAAPLRSRFSNNCRLRSLELSVQALDGLPGAGGVFGALKFSV